MTWTAQETNVLETLSVKVRTLSDEQLATGWNFENVEKAMQPLCDVSLLERREVFAHPLISLDPPVFRWDPGDPSPTNSEFEALANHFQNRWTQAEEVFTVYLATKRAANLFGSYDTSPPSTDQWTHDIHVAQIFVDMIADNPPEVMNRLVGEGAVPKLGPEIKFAKDPDLFLLDENGCAQIIFEFAGMYSEKHIRDLYLHCSGDAYRKLRKRFPSRTHYLYGNPLGTQFFLL